MRKAQQWTITSFRRPDGETYGVRHPVGTTVSPEQAEAVYGKLRAQASIQRNTVPTTTDEGRYVPGVGVAPGVSPRGRKGLRLQSPEEQAAAEDARAARANALVSERDRAKERIDNPLGGFPDLRNLQTERNNAKARLQSSRAELQGLGISPDVAQGNVLDRTAALLLNRLAPLGTPQSDRVNNMPLAQALRVTPPGDFWNVGAPGITQDIANTPGALGAAQQFASGLLTPTNAAITLGSMGAGAVAPALRAGALRLAPTAYNTPALAPLVRGLTAGSEAAALAPQLLSGYFAGQGIIGAGQSALDFETLRNDPEKYGTTLGLNTLMALLGARGLRGPLRLGEDTGTGMYNRPPFGPDMPPPAAPPDIVDTLNYPSPQTPGIAPPPRMLGGTVPLRDTSQPPNRPPFVADPAGVFYQNNAGQGMPKPTPRPLPPTFRPRLDGQPIETLPGPPRYPQIGTDTTLYGDTQGNVSRGNGGITRINAPIVPEVGPLDNPNYVPRNRPARAAMPPVTPAPPAATSPVPPPTGLTQPGQTSPAPAAPPVTPPAQPARPATPGTVEFQSLSTVAELMDLLEGSLQSPEAVRKGSVRRHYKSLQDVLAPLGESLPDLRNTRVTQQAGNEAFALSNRLEARFGPLANYHPENVPPPVAVPNNQTGGIRYEAPPTPTEQAPVQVPPAQSEAAPAPRTGKESAIQVEGDPFADTPTPVPTPSQAIASGSESLKPTETLRAPLGKKHEATIDLAQTPEGWVSRENISLQNSGTGSPLIPRFGLYPTRAEAIAAAVERITRFANSLIKQNETSPTTNPAGDIASARKLLEWVKTLGDTPQSTPAPPVPTVPEVSTRTEYTPPAATDQTETHVYGKTDTAYTPTNQEVSFRYALVPLERLLTSHIDDAGAYTENPRYDARLQNRDRSRAGSLELINEIGGERFNPRRLMASPSTSDGGPVIGPDNMVEGGNARTLGIRKAFADPAKVAAYQAELESRASELGLDPAEVKRLAAAGEKPVLVRVRQGELSPEDRKALTEDMNDPVTQRLSPAEQAQTDASRLLRSGILTLAKPNAEGDITTRANQAFVLAYMEKVVSASDRNELMTTDGKLNPNGRRRIENALAAAAYPDPDFLEMLMETEETRRVRTAILATAPKMAQLVENIKKGARYPLDITKDISQAANVYASIRRRGETIEEYLNPSSGNMFAEEAPIPLTQVGIALVEQMDAAKNSTRKLVDFLDNYIDVVNGAGNPQQQTSGIIAQKAPPRPMEAVIAAKELAKNAGNTSLALTEPDPFSEDNGNDEGGSAVRQPVQPPSPTGGSTGAPTVRTGAAKRRNSAQQETQPAAAPAGTPGRAQASSEAKSSESPGTSIAVLKDTPFRAMIAEDGFAGKAFDYIPEATLTRAEARYAELEELHQKVTGKPMIESNGAVQRTPLAEIIQDRATSIRAGLTRIARDEMATQKGYKNAPSADRLQYGYDLIEKSFDPIPKVLTEPATDKVSWMAQHGGGWVGFSKPFTPAEQFVFDRAVEAKKLQRRDTAGGQEYRLASTDFPQWIEENWVRPGTPPKDAPIPPAALQKWLEGKVTEGGKGKFYTPISELYALAKAEFDVTKDQFGEALYRYQQHLEATGKGNTVDWIYPSGSPNPADIFDVVTDQGNLVRYYGMRMRPEGTLADRIKKAVGEVSMGASGGKALSDIIEAITDAALAKVKPFLPDVSRSEFTSRVSNYFLDNWAGIEKAHPESAAKMTHFASAGAFADTLARQLLPKVLASLSEENTMRFQTYLVQDSIEQLRDDLTAQAQGLEVQIAARQSDITKEKKKRDALSADIAKKKTRLRTIEDRIAVLKHEKQPWQAKATERNNLRKEITRLDNERDKLNEKIDGLQRAIPLMEQSVADLMQHRSQLTTLDDPVTGLPLVVANADGSVKTDARMRAYIERAPGVQEAIKLHKKAVEPILADNFVESGFEANGTKGKYSQTFVPKVAVDADGEPFGITGSGNGGLLTPKMRLGSVPGAKSFTGKADDYMQSYTEAITMRFRGGFRANYERQMYQQWIDDGIAIAPDTKTPTGEAAIRRVKRDGEYPTAEGFFNGKWEPAREYVVRSKGSRSKVDQTLPESLWMPTRIFQEVEPLREVYAPTVLSSYFENLTDNLIHAFMIGLPDTIFHSAALIGRLGNARNSVLPKVQSGGDLASRLPYLRGLFSLKQILPRQRTKTERERAERFAAKFGVTPRSYPVAITKKEPGANLAEKGRNALATLYEVTGVPLYGEDGVWINTMAALTEMVDEAYQQGTTLGADTPAGQEALRREMQKMNTQISARRPILMRTLQSLFGGWVGTFYQTGFRNRLNFYQQPALYMLAIGLGAAAIRLLVEQYAEEKGGRKAVRNLRSVMGVLDRTAEYPTKVVANMAQAKRSGATNPEAIGKASTDILNMIYQPVMSGPIPAALHRYFDVYPTLTPRRVGEVPLAHRPANDAGYMDWRRLLATLEEGTLPILQQEPFSRILPEPLPDNWDTAAAGGGRSRSGPPGRRRISRGGR